MKSETSSSYNRSDVFCVIMAGGIGSRFWPLSRTDKPKQFLDILGTGKSLIQQTFSRINRFCDSQNIYVVTGSVYKDQVQEHLPEITEQQILLEPMRRNTAPCIALAYQVIRKKNPNAISVVAPSDHLVLEPDKFSLIIEQAIAFSANNDALLTIGIKPSRPETGYGYIQVSGDADKSNSSLYKVKTFTEKPNLELARVFLETGEFYWNSGIFIWSVNAIDSAFSKYLPDIHGLFEGMFHKIGTEQYAEAISAVYSECKNISIDYGVLEKADNVYVICSEFGWSDLGTWGSLYQNSSKDAHGNVLGNSNAMVYDVSNSIVNLPSNKLAVLQGLDGYIVVESEGVLLICRKEDEQEIKRYQNDVLVEKGDRFI